LNINFKSLKAKFSNISNWRILLVLGFLFALVNGIIYSQLGVKIMADSSSFLSYASQIEDNGLYVEPHYFWYIQYPIFIIAAQSIYSTLGTVVFLQYVLSFVAVCCLYFTSVRLFESKLTAFITGLLFILFFELNLYNSYILAESYFISMISISIFFLVKWLNSGFTLIYSLFGGIVLVITVLIKPTGIALLAGIIAIGIANYWQYINHSIWKIALVVLLIIPFFLLVNRMLETYGFIENYKLGEVVYGVSEFGGNPIYSALKVSRPVELELTYRELPPLLELIYFIWNYPFYWIKLFLVKLFYYLTHIRPYWSFFHNIFNLIFLLPLYFFFIRSLVHYRGDFRIRLFTIVFITMNILSVCVLSVDWDGRFLLPVLPLVFLWAGPEIARKIENTD